MVFGDGGGFVLLLTRRGVGEGVPELDRRLGDDFLLFLEVGHWLFP